MFSLFEIIFFLLMGYALFFALCMAATGIPPFPVIGKTKRIRELKREIEKKIREGYKVITMTMVMNKLYSDNYYEAIVIYEKE